jgi:hypothetical protein
LFRGEWVVYAQRQSGGSEHVLHYRARYTHRVAISNQSRLSVLLEVRGGQGGCYAVAKVPAHVLVNTRSTLRALPALSTHVGEMTVQQFVDHRTLHRPLDVGQTDSQLGELADLELDRFGFDRSSGRDSRAVGRLKYHMRSRRDNIRLFGLALRSSVSWLCV